MMICRVEGKFDLWLLCLAPVCNGNKRFIEQNVSRSNEETALGNIVVKNVVPAFINLAFLLIRRRNEFMMDRRQ